MADGKLDELDRILDAALAKYATAEPREGLEGRILAALRTERTRLTKPTWWRWSVMAALAAVIVVALALALRSDKRFHRVVATHPSSAKPAPKEALQIVSTGSLKEVRPQKRSAKRGTSIRRSQPEIVIAANPDSAKLGSPKPSSPKLDQFPSVQPLSEQEKILANFVAQYPEHAALIAEERTEALRRNEAEEMRDAAAGDEQNSQQQDR
jgi:hypothetical protein